MDAMKEHAEHQVRKPGRWGAKIVLVLVAVLIAVVAYFVLASFLPVWWANVIRNQVQGNLGAGIRLGIFYGFVFTFVPLLVAWQATHKAVKWSWKLVIVLAAVALATPNLLTAAILISNSDAAHNGQRIFGTDATWFPVWTQISAVVAVLVFLSCIALWTLWRRRGKKLRTIKRIQAEPAQAAGKPVSGSAAIVDDGTSR